jgi:hypothetical protein
MVKQRPTKIWFTIGIKQSWTLPLHDVIKAIEEAFGIKCKGFGSGRYKERQADFFVKSVDKRTKIQRFVAQNYGCKFYISKPKYRTTVVK